MIFIDKFPQITYDEFRSVEFLEPESYDVSLHELTKRYDHCVVKNFDLENPNQIALIDHIPDNPSRQCLVWMYKGQWLAKLFYDDWDIGKGYVTIDIPSVKISWRKNPDLDYSMTFYDTPLGIFEPDPWDHDYVMVWYIDPAFNPTDDRIWVMTCEVLGKSSSGTKDMGYLTPQVTLEYNPELPEFPLDSEVLMPAYWDLAYECAWSLDSRFSGNDDTVWLAKITPNYRKTKDWKWLGSVSPKLEVIVNPQFIDLKFDIDSLDLSTDDLAYECVYNLDRSHLSDSASDDIWAIKIRATDKIQGAKIKGYISPEITLITNPSIEQFIDLDFLQGYDYKSEHFDKVLVWYTDQNETDNEKIWIAKASVNNTVKKELTAGIVSLGIDRQFDVFFISYNEPNWEENWQRLLTKVPHAHHIKDVKGILQAHKQAAELSETDMFWVVDGDSYVVDDFNFDYVPKIYDRDCTFIWSSRNPVNGLVYGHSGVKLFPKRVFENYIEDYLDLSMTVNDKIKVLAKISNENRFNVDEFSSWKTGFREAVKLQVNIDNGHDIKTNRSRLNAWLKLGKDIEFGSFAMLGAQCGLEFHRLGYKSSTMINDWDFLKKEFKKCQKTK